MMKRRDFITLLGGAAAAWPLAARAQQGERVRRIGIIQTASSDDAEYQARVGALLQELQQLGWMIGRNIRIDTRWTKGDPDDARKYAAELVALAPDDHCCDRHLNGGTIVTADPHHPHRVSGRL